MSDTAAPAANAAPTTSSESIVTSTDVTDPTKSAQAADESSADDSAEDMEGDESSSEDSEQSAEEKKEAKEKAKKKLKLKVKGKEIEEEIDLNDDDRLTRAFQKEKAFDMASQELADMKKQFGSLIEQLKGEQVFEVLRQLGHNVDDLSEKHLEKLVAEAKKSPEQVERERMEKELKELKAEKDRLGKEKEERELENMRNQIAGEIEEGIMSALDSSETILPKSNPKVIRLIAQNMLFAMQNGYPDVTAAEVIPLVEAEYKKDLKEIFDVLPEETIESLVGKNNIDRMRKKRLANRKAKTQTANQIVKETGNSRKDDGSNTDDNGKKKSYRNFFSYNE